MLGVSQGVPVQPSALRFGAPFPRVPSSALLFDIRYVLTDFPGHQLSELIRYKDPERCLYTKLKGLTSDREVSNVN